MIPKKPRPKIYNRPKNAKVFSHNETGQNFENSRNDSNKARPLGNHRNYQQLFDKYNNLAREALIGGDRVSAEFHYQHADHYLRLINERLAGQRPPHGGNPNETNQRDKTATLETNREYLGPEENLAAQPQQPYKARITNASRGGINQGGTSHKESSQRGESYRESSPQNSAYANFTNELTTTIISGEFPAEDLTKKDLIREDLAGEDSENPFTPPHLTTPRPRSTKPRIPKKTTVD